MATYSHILAWRIPWTEKPGGLYIDHGVAKSQIRLRDFHSRHILGLLFPLKKFIYFNWRLITLQYSSGFCHTLPWISHGCTCVPYSEPLSHLPVYPIHLVHPSAMSLSTLSHASNLDWRSVSHMINTCFNAILANHPTLAFSHRVQKTVLYICVSFVVSHIGSLLPSF